MKVGSVLIGVIISGYWRGQRADDTGGCQGVDVDIAYVVNTFRKKVATPESKL